MPASVTKTKTLKQIYSPFSGQPADGEDGPNEKDPTLLFIYYGDGSVYGYISKRLEESIGESVEDIEIDTLPDKIDIEGAFILVVDTDWNGVNFYGFAPVGDDS